MPKNMKGPALFLAQFADDTAPFNKLDTIADWASGLGYRGLQIPSGDARLMDLDKAAESQTYCDDLKGMLGERDIEITELSTHIQGQLLAVHPAYDKQFDGFAPAAVHNNPKARTEWAHDQLIKTAQASRKLGLDVTVSFSGSLAFPYLYPWPQRPAGLIDEAFDELARRWKPVMDAYDDLGVDIAFELHPGEDLFDGATFEMLLARLNNHPRCTINYDPSHFLLQQLDYLAFIDIYHERIKAFHVKDAEFRPDGRQGVYSGYQPWVDRAGRFRSLGDGQVDFRAIFSKLAQYGYDSWA
ncbi:MAG: sugar phosphate isomerase/epimerase family protein, partial [Shimia sp.]|uniref:sugar phosphate isomerase/epimerase family protein n=1 Tax=Shimia sp. TaxID=1954381 RepID=UPI00405A318C